MLKTITMIVFGKSEWFTISPHFPMSVMEEEGQSFFTTPIFSYAENRFFFTNKAKAGISPKIDTEKPYKMPSIFLERQKRSQLSPVQSIPRRGAMTGLVF